MSADAAKVLNTLSGIVERAQARLESYNLTDEKGRYALAALFDELRASTPPRVSAPAATGEVDCDECAGTGSHQGAMGGPGWPRCAYCQGSGKMSAPAGEAEQRGGGDDHTEAAPSTLNEGLMPCPFCGGKAHIERFGDTRKSTIVRCIECGASLESGETFNHGSAWNTRRAPLPATTGRYVRTMDEIDAASMCWNWLTDKGVKIGAKPPELEIVSIKDARVDVLWHKTKPVAMIVLVRDQVNFTVGTMVDLTPSPAPTGVKVPAGWKLAPEGATPEQVEAAIQCMPEEGSDEPYQDLFRRVYAAMLSASPPAQTGEG